jgi:hypothetical protein
VAPLGCLVAAGLFWKLRITGSVSLERVAVQTLDLYVHHSPMTRAGFEALAAGRLPLWNPYQLCGVPFLATPQTGLLYPGNLLYLFLDTALAIEVSFVAHLAFSMLCLVLLCRRLCLSAAGGAAAAATFAWSGWLVFFADQAPHVSGMSWLPATLLAVDGVVRGGRAAACGLVAAVACQGLNGSIEFLAQNLYLAALFAALRLLPAAAEGRWRQGARRGLALAGCVAAGLLLAAPQLLPTLELVGVSVRSPGSLTLAQAQQGFVQPAVFLRDALGTRGIVNTGVLPLLGAALGLGLGLRGAGGAWWLGLAVSLVAGLLATGGPLFALYFGTPLGESFRRPEKFLHAYSFAQALLAGVALTRLSAWTRAGLPRRRLWRTGPWLACLGVAAAAAAFLASRGAPFPWLFAALALLLGFGLAPRPWQRGALVVGLLLLQAANLFLAASKPFPRPLADPGALDTHAALLAQLGERAGASRIYLPPELLRHPGLTPKQGTLRSLYVTSDYEPLAPRRAADFFDRAAGGPGRVFLFGRFPLGEHTRWPMLDLTATRFYVARAGSPLDAFLARAAQTPAQSGFRSIHREPGIGVYERLAPLPRAWFAPEARTLPDAEAVLAELARPGFDGRRVVLFEAQPGMPAAGPGDPGAAGSVRIRALEPEHVELAVDASGPGWVVLADAHYPGWRAYANGREAPLLRADHLFRAVAVDAGETRVSFRYTAPRFRQGLWIASATVAGTALSIFSIRHPRGENRKNRKDRP